VIERIQRDAGVDRETARTWFNEMLVWVFPAAAGGGGGCGGGGGGGG
jgi:hypothetical protein